MDLKVDLIGDWKKAIIALNTVAKGLKPVADKALRQEAEHFAGKIRENIKKGPPPPLKNKRFSGPGSRGSKPLNASGGLGNSVAVVQGESGEYFIGIPRTAKGHGGKAADLADIHEFGRSFAIVMTEKMRKFLFGVLFKSKSRRGKGGATFASGMGLIFIKIPARPFVRPAFESESPGAPERYMSRIAELLNGAVGKP